MSAGINHTRIASLFIFIGVSVLSLLQENTSWGANPPMDMNENPFYMAPCCRKSRIVTPEDFGAKGDGIADDTTPFLSALRSGFPVMCNGYYRLNKESLPTDDRGNSVFPSIKNRIVITGSGTVQFDFHINVLGIIEVRDIKLCSTGSEPNGLFSISKKGKAIFDNVLFDGTRGNHVSGGVASRGELLVTNCSFQQSDINIIAPHAKFTIMNSVFDGHNANLSSFLSNELIHIQSCKSGVIDSCIFRNSRQDIVDFYYGAKNVVFENNDVYDNYSTLFEIKAEYRNPDSLQGGNQVYNDHTENIIIKNNSFRVTSAIAWVGTRSDSRTDTRFEDGHFVRNVEFSSNRIEVLGDKKVDLWYMRNVKGLYIRDNRIQSEDAPVFALRAMESESYETCDNVYLVNNQFSSPSIVVSYISGNVRDIIIKDNSITHNNSESYLVLSSNNHQHLGELCIDNNIVNSKYPLRFCTTGTPLTCETLSINRQDVKAFYLDTIDLVSFTSCSSPIVYQRGNVKDFVIQSCSEPLIVSEGYHIRNLHIIDTIIKQTHTFVGDKGGVIETAEFKNVSNSVLNSDGISIQRSKNR